MNKDNNPYTVCIVYDKKDRDYEEFVTELTKLTESPNDILFLRSSKRNDSDKDKDQGYVVCIKKFINDKYSKDEEFKEKTGLIIKRCRPNNEILKNNMTWGFFIKTDKISPQYIMDLFTGFEDTGFIRKGSYQIVFPKPYPNGNNRNYLIVTFEKSNGTYPRNFIKKLKILINNSIVGEEVLKVNWLSNSVMKDIIQGEAKDFTKKEDKKAILPVETG
jgi:hypothetical protein